MKFTAVLVSNSQKRTLFTLDYFLTHSINCETVIVVWDGKDEPHPDLDILRNQYPITIQIIDGSGYDVYGMFNLGTARVENSKYVLFLNDDMYFSSGWDSNLVLLDETPGINLNRTVITFQLVEPGYVDVNPVNLKKDFGQTIEKFDKARFDSFVAMWNPENEFECRQLVEVEGKGGISLGWFMPVIFPTELFNEFGQYPAYPPFPYPNDVALFERMKSDSSIFFVKMNSLVYHFQRLSQRQPEVEIFDTLYDKLNLCCGGDKKDGWLNSDISDSDWSFDLSRGIIPFRDNSFTQILFKHALEHFRFQIGILVLNEIKRVLKPGGFVDIYVPNLEQACKDLLAGKNQFSDCAPAIQRVYGENYSEQRVHKWGYTIGTLFEILRQTGFHPIHPLMCDHQDEFGWRAHK